MAGLHITHPPTQCRQPVPEAAVSRRISYSVGQGFRPEALPGADCLEQEKSCQKVCCGPFPRPVLAWNPVGGS